MDWLMWSWLLCLAWGDEDAKKIVNWHQSENSKWLILQQGPDPSPASHPEPFLMESLWTISHADGMYESVMELVQMLIIHTCVMCGGICPGHCTDDVKVLKQSYASWLSEVRSRPA